MKHILTIFISSFFIVLYGMPVFAMPKIMADKQLFDAQYYSNTYPDIKAVYGDDENALYNHYKEFGISEGRNPYDINYKNLSFEEQKANDPFYIEITPELIKKHTPQYIECITLLNSCNDLWTLMHHEQYLTEGLANNCSLEERFELNGREFNGLIDTKKKFFEEAARLPNGVIPNAPGCYINQSKKGMHKNGRHYLYTYPDGHECWMYD